MVLKFDMDLLPVAYYGIYSTGGRDLRTLRKFIKDTVGKRMNALPGVASAVVQGGLEREIIIEVDRDRLKSRNVTIEQVLRLSRARISISRAATWMWAEMNSSFAPRGNTYRSRILKTRSSACRKAAPFI